MTQLDGKSKDLKYYYERFKRLSTNFNSKFR